jgi:hypothetical protein
MLRDGESTKELDSFFVPMGTVESNPAIHRRVPQGFLPRPVRHSGSSFRAVANSFIPLPPFLCQIGDWRFPFHPLIHLAEEWRQRNVGFEN